MLKRREANARSTYLHQQSAALVRRYLAYKAARAGGQLIRVTPKNTSNLCSTCERLTPTPIGDDYRCANCGLVMDRDVNAALNILARGS
ncbi:MAG TPA: transposase [Sphingomicrobium sp.]